jgi:CTP:molybdopterin cytidylyltransferase MocA
MRLEIPLVILAGGRAERMGFPKGLIDVGGETLLEQQLRRYREAGGQRAVVVLGEHAEVYRSRLPELLSIGVLNPEPWTGPFGSLQIGLAAVGVRLDVGGRGEERRFRGVFVQPVDVPPPQPSTYRALAAALGDGADVSRPRHGGKHGHPVLLSRVFASRLLGEDRHGSEARLDRQIRALPAERVASVEVDDEAVLGNWNELGDVSR